MLTTNLSVNALQRRILVLGAVFALLAVALGAFAAHGLKNLLDAYALGVFKTAVDYQLNHALGLLVIGILLGQHFNRQWLTAAAVAMLIGIIIFSGSLYWLALSGVKWLGAITPIGGVAFLVAWIFLIIAMIKPQSVCAVTQTETVAHKP